jgi:hypothetical protein
MDRYRTPARKFVILQVPHSIDNPDWNNGGDDVLEEEHPLLNGALQPAQAVPGVAEPEAA